MAISTDVNKPSMSTGDKAVDFAHIAEGLPNDVRLQPAPERALLALQGPRAAEVMAKLCEVAARLRFMTAAPGKVGSIDCHAAPSGPSASAVAPDGQGTSLTPPLRADY